MKSLCKSMDNCRFKVYNYNPAVRADAYHTGARLAAALKQKALKFHGRRLYGANIYKIRNFQL